MEKKKFYCFSKIISQPSKLVKKCDKKVTKFCSKKKTNYPPKIHCMKCRNFYIEVARAIKYENTFFFSNTMPQINVFTYHKLEYAITNDRLIRFLKI